MLLSADEIQTAIDSGELSIEPFAPSQLKPASYVLHLSNRWRNWTPSDEPLDLAASVDGRKCLSQVVTSEEYMLSQAGFCLASTAETLSLPPHLVGLVAPLSHVSRWGLCVGLGSFVVSPGFGTATPTSLTLEIASHNPSPIKLAAGVPICHLAFMRVTAIREPRPLDRSIYEGRESPSGPLLAEEWSKPILG
jgi:dCTP deaminase